MLKNKLAKVGAFAVGVTFAFGVFAAPAGAQTVAELQAQINALMAQLAALQGGSTTSNTTGYNFTQNLTVGSTGADVTSLQQFLVGGGYLNMPAGVSYGYFGPLTRSAVAAWQAANGISPAVGYFGPISRAKANTMGGVVTPGTPSTPGAGITTPGVEGTITATLNPTPVSGVKVYEGDNRKGALGIKLEAKTSDMRVERVKVQLPSTTFYNRVASRIYIMDGSTVLGSADLNSSTVVREGSNYFITVAGMNYVVPKDASRVLTVAFDFNSSIDNTYRTSYNIVIPAEGVRAMDGAGINQFSPSSGTTLTRSISVESELATSATLQLSLNVNSPVAKEVVASAGSDNDELDGLELLRFDLRAEKDDVKVEDLTVSLTRGENTSTATSTTLYLYDGSSLIGSATVDGTSATAMSATFTNIDYVVPRDTTKTLTVKTDIRTAGTAATTFVASVTSGSGVIAENTLGDNVAETGSATGETMTVRKIGIEVTLVSKSISKSSTPLQNNISTSTAEAQFVLRVKAVGGDIMFGDNASTTYPMVSNAKAPARSFVIYTGGAVSNPAVASSTSFSVPSGVVTSGLTNSFTLQRNNTVDIPVSFLFEGRTTASALVTTGSYAVGLERINWVSSAGQQSSTFMAGKTEWRSATVSMP